MLLNKIIELALKALKENGCVFVIKENRIRSDLIKLITPFRLVYDCGS